MIWLGSAGERRQGAGRTDLPAVLARGRLSRNISRQMARVTRVFRRRRRGAESTTKVEMASIRHMEESIPRVTSMKKNRKLQSCGSGRVPT